MGEGVTPGLGRSLKVGGGTASGGVRIGGE